MLIWGESANLRFLPESLCFIFHKIMVERLSNKNSDIESKSLNLYPGFYLDHVVTPIYEVIQSALKSPGDHMNKKTYDDLNLSFSKSFFNIQLEIVHQMVVKEMV